MAFVVAHGVLVVAAVLFIEDAEDYSLCQCQMVGTRGEGALRGGEGADNILFKIVGHKGNLFLATGE